MLAMFPVSELNRDFYQSDQSAEIHLVILHFAYKIYTKMYKTIEL